jgi:hypothetical protein
MSPTESRQTLDQAKQVKRLLSEAIFSFASPRFVDRPIAPSRDGRAMDATVFRRLC